MRHRCSYLVCVGLVITLATASAAVARSRTFYVSPRGDASPDNPGTSPERPWRTAEQIAAARFEAGDSLLFEGGLTWTGAVVLSPSNVRAGVLPFTVGSYGGARATISSGDQIAVMAVDIGAVHVVDLNVIGGSPLRAIFGLAFQNSTKRTLENIQIRRVDIQGFSHAIDIRVGDPPSKYRSIVLDEVVAHHNASGPNLVGYPMRPASTHNYDYGLIDVRVSSSRFHDNTGYGQWAEGAGLHVWNVDGLRISRNVLFNNGGENPGQAPDYDGPSAILVYDARDTVIAQNEIFHQRYDPRTPADAAGIDVWGERTLIQYNFVHDNEGPAINIASDPPDPAQRFFGLSRQVTIRYNVLANNGMPLSRRGGPLDALGMQVHLFGPVSDFEIYNNTVFVKAMVNNPGGEHVYGLLFITDTGSGPYARLHVRNNVFAVGGNAPLLRVQWMREFSDVRFENNAYLTTHGEQPINWGFTLYRSVQDWARATGQELIGGGLVARVGSVSLLCGADSTAAWPRPPHELESFRLQTSPPSPLIDGALDLRRPPYGLDVGEVDFFMTRIPAFQGFDIGAHEADRIQSCGR